MSESKALSLALELLRLKRQMRGSMRLFSNTQISQEKTHTQVENGTEMMLSSVMQHED